MKLFKPEDFDIVKGVDALNWTQKASDRANQILGHEMKKWPRVYFSYEGPNSLGIVDTDLVEDCDTHTALLAFIEPIKCEKHEPKVMSNEDGYNQRYICKHCGVELVAEWKAKGE
jgi:hypothetical protein